MENQLVKLEMSFKAQQKRDLIIKSSLFSFNKLGYHDSRIEDIIREAGVGKGTFYLYFKNKEEVVIAILDQFLLEIKTTLDWVQLNIEDVKSLRKLFLEEASKLSKTFIKNQEAARFLFREGQGVSRAIETRIKEHIASLIKASEETYQFALSVGIIDKVHPKVAAMAVVGGIAQIYQQWLEEPDMKEDLSILIEATVDFYLRALGLTPTS